MTHQITTDNLPINIKNHIEKLEKIRQDFVANVSHELRTPLTVIRGYIEALSANDNPFIQDNQKIFDQLQQHSLRMEIIINDLLLLSRLESEAYEESKENNTLININLLLDMLHEDAQSIGAEKNHLININAHQSLEYLGCENEIKSLFSNLIINAIKYTPSNGKINIQCKIENNNLIFSVTDTGVGIEEKHIPRLTERFYRVNKSRSRNSGGTGLGLAIVKHILARFDGRLDIQSTLGKGSTFTCTLPISR